MSDFQKQTLKNYGRVFLILCGVVLLIYEAIRSELIRYSVFAILVFTIGGIFAWGMIRVARWDWWLRGKLTAEEYKAYKACDCIFGWRDDKYLPTGDQIVWMAERNDISCETLWSMFEKLKGENQNGKQMP